MTELPPPTDAPLARRLQAVAPWLLLVAITWAMTGPILDPDFWWHLASGRWIWRNGAIPHADPFGIPMQLGEPPLRSEFVLRQFWLAQLVLYGVHALAGARGVILLRALIHGAMFALVFRRLRRRGAGPLTAAALLSLAAWVIVDELGYVADRPQAWTTLFVVVLLDLLDRLFDGDRRVRWLLPAFMVLWANLHGGFVVGDGIIVVSAVGRVGALRRDWRPFAIAGVSVLASGLNPNAFDAGWQVLATMVDAPFTAYWASIVETQSLFDHATAAGIARRLPALTALAVTGAVGIAAMLARPRSLQPHVLLLALLATLMGARAIRFVFFFAIVAAETGALGLAPWAARLRHALAARLPRPLLPGVAAGGLVALAVVFAVMGGRSTALAEAHPYDDSLDPAIAFIREHGLTGRLFDEHDDGGYLLNALEPGVRVLIDGRVLSLRAFELARLARDAPEAVGVVAAGLPTWRAGFAYAGIDMVLLPGADRASGALVRLTELLLRDPEWEVVFADRRAILFVGRAGRLGWFARANALPRRLGYDNMLAIAMAAARGGHGRHQPGWLLAAAVAYAGRGELGQALEAATRYLAVDPRDPIALSIRARAMEQGGR